MLDDVSTDSTTHVVVTSMDREQPSEDDSMVGDHLSVATTAIAFHSGSPVHQAFLA